MTRTTSKTDRNCIMPKPQPRPTIEIIGARMHNLQNIDVSIPLNAWTAITGVSGSGKSSLVFDTIHAEGQRRYFETLSTAARRYLDQLERPDVDRIDNLPATIAVGQKQQPRGGITRVSQTIGIESLLVQLFVEQGQLQCPDCRIPVRTSNAPDALRAIAALPADSRFQVCFPALMKSGAKANAIDEEKRYWDGEGLQRFLDLPSGNNNLPAFLVIVDRLKSGGDEARIAESVEQAFSTGLGRCILLVEPAAAKAANYSGYSQAIADEQSREWTAWFFYREPECPSCGLTLPPLDELLFRTTSPDGMCSKCNGHGYLQNKAKKKLVCPECDGLGLGTVPRLTQLQLIDESPQLTFAECLHRAIAELLSEIPEEITGPQASIVRSLRSRLEGLAALGLGSLTLSRLTRTLSTGEFQRLGLAAALNDEFVNTLYLFDEPTAGLHPRDRAGIGEWLRRFVDQGNTVITIEHHEDVVQAADHVIELGPEAGSNGGTITASVPAAEYRLSIPEEEPAGITTDDGGQLQLTGVTCHNLSDLLVAIPLRRFVVVTGVCGSGKTSLIFESLYPALIEQLASREGSTIKPPEFDDPFAPPGSVASITGAETISDCVLMNETQLAGSSRSTPATYLKVFDDIRKLFAETTDAQTRGYKPSRFSFNTSRGGRCQYCEGIGSVEIDMQFLANLNVRCPECKGTRFAQDTLEVSYRNRNIADVLAMTVDEAFAFFRNHQLILRKLQLLRDVGLGYLTLGQPTRTLSRGEAQRLKLASYLNAASGTQMLFLFDEPASGLHPSDIATLLKALRRLVEQGHSVVVIDYEPQVTRQADWVIELGPGAANNGGSVVFEGPPA